MSIKAIELTDGCFARAEDDEPMFVLLARDGSAPRLVREWAVLRREDVQCGFKPRSDLARADEADALADLMVDWQMKHRPSAPIWRPAGCDCQNPEPKSGVALVSVDCPIHGDLS